MQEVSSSKPTTQSESSRQSWIDAAKGWGILLVVVGHALRGLHNVGLLEPVGWSHALDAWIYSFHMPLFFLLSGFFIEKAVRKPLDRALKDRAKTILWPYLLWSVLQTLVQIRMSSFTSSQTDWSSLWSILWKPVMQFWFLYVLLLLSLIWLGLRRLNIPAVVLVAAAWLLHFLQSDSGVWAMWDLVKMHGAWFASGALLGTAPKVLEAIRQTPAHYRYAGVILGFGMTSLAAIMIPDRLLMSNAFWALPCLLASLLLAMSLNPQAILTRGLAWLGAISLEIFLVHTLASATMRALLLHGFKIHDVVIHLLLATLAGVLIPIAMVLISRRLKLRHIFRFGTVA